MVVGVIGNDYCLRDGFEKIEEKLGKTMTKEEGQSIEKDLAEVKSTTEGLKTDMNELLKDQDELKAYVSARVQKIVMDCVNQKRSRRAQSSYVGSGTEAEHELRRDEDMRA